MNTWRFKICALLLAISMIPGIFEVLENAAHLVGEGHLAHLESATTDHHEPVGPEHGCTQIFHVCACHTSMTFLTPTSPISKSLSAAERLSQPDTPTPLLDVSSTLDRPPRA